MHSRWIVGVVLVVAGCSSDGSSSSSAPVQVTGGSVPPTGGAEQAETAMSVQIFSGQPSIVTTTYNDETGEIPTYVQYPTGDRKVFAGYSLLGYSVSTNSGTSFTYQPGPKARPPTGWDTLWGDPSITSSVFDQHYVYINGLAVSHQSFPYVGNTDKKNGAPGQGFIQGSVEWDQFTGLCPPGIECSYIDGACIARSTDAGVHFNPVVASDCVTNNHDFYDGSSITTDWNGAVYAAYNNVTHDREDVWIAPSPTAPFNAFNPSVQPFAGVAQLISHPVLRHDYSTNRIYIIAFGSPFTVQRGQTVGSLYIDYYDPATTTWHGPVLLPFANVLETPIILRGLINGVAGNVRTGQSFSFDLGTPSVNGNDEIRIVSMVQRNGTATSELDTVICPRSLVGCIFAPQWSTAGVAGEQFNPTVVAQPGWPGIVPPVWKVSYNSTEFDTGGITLAMMHTTLAVTGGGTRLPWAGNIIVTHQPLCPDSRTVSGVVEGYWGDYDDIRILSTDASGVTTFIRTHTDSTSNLRCFRDTFTSSPVHVSGHTCQ